MYQKFKDLFTKNLSWKAFSILMATLLWFIVMNIHNPTEIKTFLINLNVSNLLEIPNSSLAVLNIDEIEDTKIELKLKATRPVLDDLTKKFARGDIKAYIETDLISKYPELEDPLEINLPIRTNLYSASYSNNNFDIVSFSPTNIYIKLDNKITVPKKVYVKLTGNIKPGYTSLMPELSSEYVQVTGAKSVIEKIESVQVESNITNKVSTFTETLKPMAYDKFENLIEDVSFNIKEIDVKIPINLKGNIKVNSPILQGDLKYGYYVKNVSYYPKDIDVVGDEKILNTISNINLPKINISNLEESKEFSFNINDLINKYNIKLKNNEVSEIKVFVEIEKTINKKIKIESSKLDISGINDKFIDLPDFIEIEINGPQDNINNINLDDIKIRANIDGLGNGEHNVNLQVDLPKGIYLTGEVPYINIIIKDEFKEEGTINETTTQIENN